MADTLSDQEFEELKKRAEAMRPKYPEISLKALLEDTPPDVWVYVTDLIFRSSTPTYIQPPSIALYCDHEMCSGQRQFTPSGSIYLGNEWHNGFLTYTCRNCNSRSAHFALRYIVQSAPTSNELGRGMFVKVGQQPAFGPQTPSKLISLIGPDRDTFLQGRRAENRGMGVGAFAYYRRVVENQKIGSLKR